MRWLFAFVDFRHLLKRAWHKKIVRDGVMFLLTRKVTRRSLNFDLVIALTLYICISHDSCSCAYFSKQFILDFSV